MASRSLVVKPQTVVTPPLYAQPIPKKLGEMSETEWETYQKNGGKWYAVYASKSQAALVQGKYLYHATPSDNLGNIKAGGLLPRDPAWKKYKKAEKVPRFDSSKDGYLSMATTYSGAGAMGGKAVTLRMKIEGDIGTWDFRQYGGTEVRTLLAIPADKLEVSSDGEENGPSWRMRRVAAGNIVLVNPGSGYGEVGPQ